MSRIKIDKKEKESIKYIKKYKKRIIFENIKVYFFKYGLKNIFILIVLFLISSIIYKVIKWEAVFYDYQNKAGLIFGDIKKYNNNTHNEIDKELNQYTYIDNITIPPVINNPNTDSIALDETFVKKVIFFLQNKNINVKQIEITNNSDIYMYLDNGIYLKVNQRQNIDELITNIIFIYKDDITNKIIINKNKNIEYIDLRFGDKIFYKDKNIFDKESIIDNSDLKIKDIDVIIPNY